MDDGALGTRRLRGVVRVVVFSRTCHGTLRIFASRNKRPALLTVRLPEVCDRPRATTRPSASCDLGPRFFKLVPSAPQPPRVPGRKLLPQPFHRRCGEAVGGVFVLESGAVGRRRVGYEETARSCSGSRRTTLHCPTTLHYPKLPCTTLHYPTLPCIALH